MTTHTIDDPDGSAVIQRFLMSWPDMGETAEEQIAFLTRFLNGIEPYRTLDGYRGRYIRELAEQLRRTIGVYQGEAGAG